MCENWNHTFQLRFFPPLSFTSISWLWVHFSKLQGMLSSLTRHSPLMKLEMGIYDRAPEVGAGQAFTPPISEWALRCQHPPSLPLLSAVSNSSCAELCISLFPRGQLSCLPWDKCPSVTIPEAKPLLVGQCPDNFLHSTLLVECPHLSPWTNLPFFNNVTSAATHTCVQIPNMEFVIIPAGWGLISAFVLCIKSQLINHENMHAGGIFKLHEQIVSSTLAAFMYIPVNVVLIIN